MIYVSYFKLIFIFDLGLWDKATGLSQVAAQTLLEGDQKANEAILIMLFVNVANRIMHTTLSSTQSESARFYSMFGLDNIYSPSYKVNLH